MSTSTATSSNNIASALLTEMEQEAATTRKCLERLPSNKFHWMPHDRSMPMGRLAAHCIEMFGWTGPTLQNSELDFAKQDYKPYEPHATEDLLERFDKTVSEAMEVLRNTPDETFSEDWSLKNGDMTYFTMSKFAVMRTFVLNHIIHHRGQLSVYMRLNDVPVPSIYGPSADEGQV